MCIRDSLGEKGMQELIGRKGVCLTPLRPSGNADFGGKRLDVVTSGEFISKGSYIRIESIENLRVLVREISQDEYNSKEEMCIRDREKGVNPSTISILTDGALKITYKNVDGKLLVEKFDFSEDFRLDGYMGKTNYRIAEIDYVD